MIRDAVESLYFDKCDVYEYKQIKDNDTHITSGVEVKVFEDLSCRLVYKNISAAVAEYGINAVNQSTELIISPDYDIKPGSKVVVTKQTGQTTEYKSSGQPSYYSTHQQIMLELFKEWA